MSASSFFYRHGIAEQRTRLWPALFSWRFCNSVANLHEIFTRLRKRVNIKVWKMSHKYVKFHPMKLSLLFNFNLLKITLVAFRPRCITGWCKKSIYFHRRWSLTYISYTHQNCADWVWASCRFSCLEKLATTFVEGCSYLFHPRWLRSWTGSLVPQLVSPLVECSSLTNPWSSRYRTNIYYR